MGELRSRVLASTACAAIALLLAGAIVVDRQLVAAGRSSDGLFGPDDLPFVVAMGSATAVGAVLAFRRPLHPVGWLFLALGGSLAATGLLDGYGALHGSGVATDVARVTFIGWFVLLALVLHLTPTGRPLWRWAPAATVAVGIVWFGSALLGPSLVEMASGVLTGLGLVVAGFSLLIRFRRSEGVVRRQLLWMAVAVVPLPVFVAVAFYASPDHPVLLSLATSGFIVLIPIAAGLSIAQYHLYDVESILSRAVTYLLVSGVLVITFAAVVFTAGRLAGGRSNSHIPAILATLAAVALAGPVYRAFQEAVDRRFNRRRFDTLSMIRSFVREPGRRTVQEVLREALRDPGLRTAYWVADREQWVSDTGGSVAPGPDDIVVRRLNRSVARIMTGADRELAEAACLEALPELENAGLRAAINLQLVEVRASRARIAAAELAERRRIERDLHDGAQQRLLALALNLRAAQLNGQALPAAVDCAIVELRAAVAELRELANGLSPVGDAGLGPAIDELAARLPLPMATDVVDRRFPAAVEATTWFIICEAVTNAVKHADATTLELSVTTTGDLLVVRIEDNGRGGANPHGTGLRGLLDRTEATGGRLTVEHRPGGGTVVIGELPCGS